MYTTHDFFNWFRLMSLLGTKGVDVTEFNVETGGFIRAFVPELQVPYFLFTLQH